MKTMVLALPRRQVILFALLSFAAFPSLGQITVGADVMSRYIWRGVDYGNSPSFQPALGYTVGPLSVGTWGAYSFAGTGTVFAEHDLWASLEFETGSGSFSLIVTDYYYPSAGLKFFNYDGNGGAHTLETGIGYSGPESFPVALTGYFNIHNDPDKSVYIELAYPFAVDGVGLDVFVGGSLKKSDWYLTEKAGIINIGLSAKKSLVVTESFSIPVSASYVINPTLEQSYLIFGLSF